MGHYRGPNIVRTGLDIVLDAGSQRSYPGTGTTWYDLSGKNNHFTLANGLESGFNANGYFTFDASNDLAYNDSLNTTIGASGTCVVWMKPNASQNDGTYNGIFSYGPRNCDANTFLMSMNNSLGPTMAKWCNDFTSPTATMNSTQWWQYTLRIDGPSVTFFLNATNAGTGTITSTVNGVGRAQVGATDLAGRYYRGDIASVLFYNRALTDDEVDQNFKALRSRYGR